MTMKERITRSVEEKLSAAVDGERKQEIVEELSGNLYAKYEDQVAAGADPEEAYEAAMDSLGDVSELIDLAGGTKMKAEWNAAKDSVSDWGQRLSQGLDEAVGSVVNAARAMKGPLKDMGKSIADAVRSLEVTVTVQDQHQFDYSVPADDITGLEARLKSGDVMIHTWDEDTIQVIERSSRSLDENKHATFTRREDGVLCIQQGATAAGWASLGFGIFSSDFEIYLPRRLWQSLDLRSEGSGDVILEDPLEARRFSASSTSGDVDLGEGSRLEAVEVSSVSGDITARGLICRSFTSQGTSGDLEAEFALLPEELTVKTVSGDVTLTLPENEGFALAYHQVSGDLDAAFEMTTSVSRRDGIASYKGAQAPRYDVTTVSGDIDIEKRPG